MLTCHEDDADNNVHDVMIIIASINIIINMITMAIILTRTSSLWHFIRGTGLAEKEGPCLMSTSQPNLVMKIAMTMMTKMMTMAIKTNLISLLKMSTWPLARPLSVPFLLRTSGNLTVKLARLPLAAAEGRLPSL